MLYRASSRCCMVCMHALFCCNLKMDKSSQIGLIASTSVKTEVCACFALFCISFNAGVCEMSQSHFLRVLFTNSGIGGKISQWLIVSEVKSEMCAEYWFFGSVSSVRIPQRIVNFTCNLFSLQDERNCTHVMDPYQVLWWWEMTGSVAHREGTCYLQNLIQYKGGQSGQKKIKTQHAQQCASRH